MSTAFSLQRWLGAGRRIERCSAQLGVASLALGLACSASDRGRPSLRVSEGDPEGPVFYETGDSNSSSGAPSTGSSVVIFVEGQAPPASGTISIDDACVIKAEPAELVRQPVDIIVLLDNSGSMDDEAGAVEANLNVNFASVLSTSAVDYRVILISRHRTQPREESGPASTSVCVQTPLSGLASCESAPEPVFSERFRQYSTKIESDDSFDVALDTYAPPFEDKDREEKFDRAPLGWSEWLRPGAKKVFLEVTDDDEDMSATRFADELTRLAPEHFGSDPVHPGFVFHSIVGLVEKNPPTAAYLPSEPVTAEKCTGNDGDVTSAGETYQELSRLTGGLRFPLCQFDAYDVVFQRIAEDVVLTRGVACDFAIPPPPRGLALDLDNIAIAYASGTGGTTAQLGQAPSSSACQADAFYITGDRLNLCPETCSRVRSDPLAAVNVLFTCRSQIIVPR
ncbi:MAG: hypothetical protein ABI895_11705 [Deltaproteobacteria bacterium]